MQMLVPGVLVGGRYRVGDKLGAGGMGIVYRADHIGLRRPVALKILDGAVASSEQRARFDREARCSARLDHPGIVRVLDYGPTGSNGEGRFIAMELLDGPTLAHVLARRDRLSVREAIDCARQLLDALAHAHAQGVLHRDVKPENVMSRGGKLVLIDFGLARLADDASLTGEGRCFGSVSYIAPERLLGAPYDARADLYAVGVMLYEMLAGDRPFRGAQMDVVRHHIHTAPPSIRALRPDVPAALEAVILRALAKDPTRRPPSAAAMSAELAAAILPRRAAASPPPIPDPSTVIELRIEPEPMLARLWSWLRYGAWRWRDEDSGAVR